MRRKKRRRRSPRTPSLLSRRVSLNSSHIDAEPELFGNPDCAAREVKRGAEALDDVYRLEEAPEQVLTIFSECMKSQQCAPLKHHYDECAERVTQQQEENGKADEDCVEECMLKILPDYCQHGVASCFSRVSAGFTSTY
jgi:hypothetical protein